MTRAFILRLFESYFRHRWLNLLPILLMVVVSSAYVYFKPRQYTTQGLIYVPGQSYLATLTDVTIDPSSPWVSPSQGTANEIKELLQTDTFIRSIIAKTDLAPQLNGNRDSVRELITDARTAVWATTQGDNQVLIGSEHKDPVVAYQLASAIIDNYTQWKIDANLAQGSVAQTFFADLVKQYTTEVDAARQALNQYSIDHPAPLTGNRPDVEQNEIDRLKTDLDQAQSRLTAALDKQENARLAASQVTVNTRQSLYVVDAPTIPDRPATSLKTTALQSGLFVAVGFLVTLVLIIGSAVIDRSFLFPLDVTQQLNLPVLATVPDATPRRRWFGRQPQPVYGGVVIRPTPALRAGLHYESGRAPANNKLAPPHQPAEPGPTVGRAD